MSDITAITGIQLMHERGMRPDISPDGEDGYSGEQFQRFGLPMIVGCETCDATLVFPSAIIVRGNGTVGVFCRDCGPTPDPCPICWDTGRLGDDIPCTRGCAVTEEGS